MLVEGEVTLESLLGKRNSPTSPEDPMASLARAVLLLTSLIVMLFPIACDGQVKEVQVIIPDRGEYAMEIDDGSVLPILFTGPKAYLQLVSTIKVKRVLLLKQSKFVEDLLGSNAANVSRTMGAGDLQIRLLHFDGAQIVTTVIALGASFTPQFGDGLEVWSDGKQLIAVSIIDINGQDVPGIGDARVIDSHNFTGSTTFETNSGYFVWGERFTQNGWMPQEGVEFSWNGDASTDTLSMAPSPGQNVPFVASFTTVHATIGAQNLSPTTKVGEEGTVIVDASVNTNPGFLSTVYQFTGSALTPAGEVVQSWLWNFGDGSPTSSLQNPTHQYASTGIKNVTLTVTTNASSQGQDTVQVTVNQNLTLTVTYTYDVGTDGFYFTFWAQSPSYTGYMGDKLKLRFAYIQEPGTIPAVHVFTMTMVHQGGGQYKSDEPNYGFAAIEGGIYRWWIEITPDDQGLFAGTQFTVPSVEIQCFK